ncbi:MAG TPA: PilX N-terminal domain-containing pilus assembly protein [Sulfuriferula sp.]|nr:PilX N-terminal domain-containing pilus assembly protein [Sulfuriferula sp.]
MDKLPISSSRQSGMALMVSLIFLVLLTLLAVSAMHGTILQERMAGNTRDRMLAFQSAEAALRTAESLLGNAGLPSGTGIYMVPNTSPAATYTSAQQWDTSYPWTTSAASLTGGSISGVASQPLYVIERLTTTPPSSGPQVKLINFGPTAGQGYFRITSRGVGATTNAAVILQEYFIR